MFEVKEVEDLENGFNGRQKAADFKSKPDGGDVDPMQDDGDMKTDANLLATDRG